MKFKTTYTFGFAFFWKRALPTHVSLSVISDKTQLFSSSPDLQSNGAFHFKETRYSL